MYLKTTIILVAMVASFTLSSWKLKSPEISMVIAAIVGALVAGLGFPVRVLVEGLFTNLDIAILFVCASVFVNVYSFTGAMNVVTRKLVQSVDSKWLLLVFMAVFMLIPGALTGAGSVSVFVVGGLVATVVRYMGLSEKKTVAFVFIFAILSAAAPPINLWTMLMTAQANMPYVGFTKLLLIPILIVGAFTIVYLGWGTKRESKEKILAELPEATVNMGWFRILAPLAVVVVLILLSLYTPFSIPVFGLPLMFILATACAIACNPSKVTVKDYYKVLSKTMEQVFPLLGDGDQRRRFGECHGGDGRARLARHHFCDPADSLHIHHRALLLPLCAGLFKLWKRDHLRHAAHLHVQRGGYEHDRRLRRLEPNFPDRRLSATIEDSGAHFLRDGRV